MPRSMSSWVWSALLGWLGCAGAADPVIPGAGSAGNWQGEVQRSIAAQEYQVSAQPAADCAPADYAGDTIRQAPNRAHNLRSCFTAEGVQVVPRTGASRWRWGLSLTGYGDGESFRTPPAATPQASGNRVEYVRGPLTEWYVNDARGLEQGFTLHAPVTSGATAVLHIGISGDLRPQLVGATVEFQSAAGVRVLEYGKLEARDAAGRELPATMALVAGAIELRVATAGARYPVTVDPLATSPAWTVESNQADAWLGYSVATAGDVNGDGFSDVIVGVPFYDNGEADEGRVYVFHGDSDGPGDAPSWTIEGQIENANLGYSVATAGDVNGDDYSDVVVGAPTFSGGTALTFHGGPTGLSTTPSWVVPLSQAFAAFGQAVAPAGDVNGDGYSDVIVGAPGYGAGGQFNEGAALVFHGSATGLSTIAARTIEGGQNGAELGISVSTAGDVNGDGYSDVIVGAWRYDLDQPSDNRGVVFGFHGGPTGLGGSEWFAAPTIGNTDFGVSIATAGDFNGDGYSDVVVGAPLTDALGMTDSGVLYFYQGSATGLSLFTIASNDSSDLARLGTSVASAGDVNGDGYSDVVVGAPNATGSGGQSLAGRAAIYYGNANFDLSLDEYVVDVQSVPASNTRFGWSVATAGDVNGDGFSDLIIGARDFESEMAQANEGRASVYYGGPNRPGQLAGWTAEGGNNAADLGFSVASAGDVNGDGYGDVIVGVPYYDDGENAEGRALAYLGSATGLANAPAWAVESNRPEATLGNSVAGAGDVNGDGYGDVIVGAASDSNGQMFEGRAYVYHGSPIGLAPGAARVLEANLASAQFGRSVGTAGDVNGDGYSDVIVGAPAFTNGQSEEGRAFVYLGTPSGISASAHWMAEPNLAFSDCGRSAATAGDINGDGYSDVIVGCPGYTNGEIGEGAAFLYEGGAAGLDNISDWSVEANAVNVQYGESVATAGDVDGDGFADVIVAAPGYEVTSTNYGAALVYLGAPTGLQETSSWIGGGIQPGFNALSAASAGDINGDGYADVLIGIPGLDSLSVNNAGGVYAYLGGPGGLDVDEYWQILPTQAEALVGYSVASAGDVNGDGFDEILVGAPFGEGSGPTDEGRAFLYYGNGPVASPSALTGRGGLNVSARQLAAGSSLAAIVPLGDPATPLAALGGTGTLVDGVILRALARTPFGRGDVALEWELHFPGIPFLGADSAFSEPGWTDSGLQGAPLSATPEGLASGELFGWRLRIRYRPSTTPYQPHGPWLTSSVNALQGFDFRTEKDSDADDSIDRLDNCKLVANLDQRDTNADGFGNICDGDLNNGLGLVNLSDLALFRAAFGTANPDADFNGNGGLVNLSDLAIFRALFGKPPGPSGYHPP